MKQTLGILVGLISGFVIILFSQYVSSQIFGSPTPQVLNNKILMNEYIKGMPSAAFFVIILGYILASFFVGLIASKIDNESSLFTAIICSLLLNIAGIYNSFLYDHPLWFIILNFIVYIPSSHMGYKISKKF